MSYSGSVAANEDFWPTKIFTTKLKEVLDIFFNLLQKQTWLSNHKLSILPLEITMQHNSEIAEKKIFFVVLNHNLAHYNAKAVP